MIADDFIAQADAIPYPNRADYAERAEHTEAYGVYGAAHAEINRAFGVALADEYLSEISETRRPAVAERVFRLAWEDGHSSGYYEVENRYMDLADLALAVYSAATS